MENAASLRDILDGWDGYNTALVRAVAPRAPEELAWRPAPGMRSVGEVAAHIALGRIDWFHRMGAPGADALHARLAPPYGADGDITESALAADAAALAHWLSLSWDMVEANLRRWTVADLSASYRQPYGSQVYAVSRQWVILRILLHDAHHGGQISAMLAQQGIPIPDLGDLGGHITEPPLANPTTADG